MSETILVLNAGSSSLKLALFRGGTLGSLCRGDASTLTLTLDPRRPRDPGR